MITEDELRTVLGRFRHALKTLEDILAALETPGADPRADRYEAVRDDYVAGTPLADMERRHGLTRRTIYNILDRFPDVVRRNAQKAQDEVDDRRYAYVQLAHRPYPQAPVSDHVMAAARTFGIDLTPKTAPDGTEPPLDPAREGEEQASYDRLFADPDKVAALRRRAQSGVLRPHLLEAARVRGIDLLGSPDSDLF